jgi:hypothetical protein
MDLLVEERGDSSKDDLFVIFFVTVKKPRCLNDKRRKFLHRVREDNDKVGTALVLTPINA